MYNNRSDTQNTGRSEGMMNPETGRATMFAIVGGYLIYMAYELLTNLINKVATSMPAWLQILVIIFFTGTGIALLFFAWKVWKKGREDHDKNPVDLEAQEESAKTEEDASEK